jgi:hypothetical protein
MFPSAGFFEMHVRREFEKLKLKLKLNLSTSTDKSVDVSGRTQL